VLLFNLNDVDFHIKEGDRVAQFIIEKITETEIVEVDDLDDTERGTGGFGSTGVSLNN
jgi:dUTP pyrophosphatase